MRKPPPAAAPHREPPDAEPAGAGGPPAHVYLLRCADGSLYCGWTTDLDRRLAAHNRGVASRYTASRRPVAYAAAWPAAGRSEAMRREAQIKRLSRAEKLALVAATAAAATRSEPAGCDPADAA